MLKWFQVIFISVLVLEFIMVSCADAPNPTYICNPNAEYIDSAAGKKVDLYFMEDIEVAIDCSNELNKPILTIYECEVGMSSRYVLYEMFENEKVHKLVSENFIFNFLSVCDKTKLDKPYFTENNEDSFEIQTEGDVNMHREITKYNMNTQPIYAITDFDDVDLVEFLTYSEIGNEYSGMIKFLETGLSEFNKRHN